MKISVQNWGTMPDGSDIQLYTLENDKGTRVRISTLGAIVQAIETPDRDGKLADIVMGFDDAAGYLVDGSYQGAAIGRFGNRIGGARFTLDGVEYKLAANEGENCLHGGRPSFERALWRAASVHCESYVGVDMFHFSPDGQNGFPGNVDVIISFRLNERNELSIAYKATTDKATPLNMTHHMYYNLSGDFGTEITDHVLRLAADRTTTVNAKMVPTGEIDSIIGNPFDFNTPTVIGQRIDADNEQLRYGGGYDHNLIFSEADGSLKLQGEVSDPKTGRVMELLTTEPAVQFYTGNCLGGDKGKGGLPNAWRHAVCLETQHYPDSPNHENFPSTIVRPGDVYTSETVLRFSAK
ncbi:MAG: galactose mutarotase [Opitutales bacterium]|nr:galactose mutarotase [Opitutales bacterium]